MLFIVSTGESVDPTCSTTAWTFCFSSAGMSLSSRSAPLIFNLPTIWLSTWTYKSSHLEWPSFGNLMIQAWGTLLLEQIADCRLNQRMAVGVVDGGWGGGWWRGGKVHTMLIFCWDSMGGQGRVSAFGSISRIAKNPRWPMSYEWYFQRSPYSSKCFNAKSVLFLL